MSSIYVNNLKSYDAGLEEIGNIHSRAKIKAAAKYERKRDEREFHSKSHSHKRKSFKDYYDEEYYG